MTVGNSSAGNLLQEREQVAQRLLEASARHSFDPNTELDWDQPFEDGKWFWPPELCSLYATPLREQMSEKQRVEPSKHESASLARGRRGRTAAGCRWQSAGVSCCLQP